MRKLITILLLVIGIIAMGYIMKTDSNPSPSEETGQAEYHKISPEEAKELMLEGNIILDVRTSGEYAEGHIEGAQLLPVDVIQEGDYQGLENKDQVILVYCRSGNRSKTASKALVEAGYTQVYDFGGIANWPYDIVKD